jgi:hypothetical protein
MAVYKSYLRRVAAWASLLVLGAVGCNILVDPYAVFGAPRVSGFNELKPFAGDRGRIGKLHAVLRVAPAGLIAGNSRPEMGLSPEHPCWPAEARPVYNIALPGLSVYSQIRYVQHAQAVGPVRAMVMGVDFSDFLHASEPGPPMQRSQIGANAEAEPFAVDADGRRNSSYQWSRFADYVDAALSLDALGHSLATLARQHGELVPTRTPLGFNPAEPIYQPIIRAEGPLVLFEQKLRELAERFDGPDLRLVEQGWAPDFAALRSLVRQNRDGGTVTVLFINPYHAEYLILVDAAGLWREFEAWKRELAELALGEGVPLWDFTGFDRYSTEAVDALPLRGRSLDWFWEPAHYRRELGDLVLANVWRASCPPDHADAPRYGVRLDRTALDTHFAAQRSARDAYKEAHPEVVDRIQALFAP